MLLHGVGLVILHGVVKFNAFGNVDGAAASDGNNAVAAAFAVFFDSLADLCVIGVGSEIREYFVIKAERVFK